MNQTNSVTHHTFSIERTYPQSPDRVFFVFSNEAASRRWRAEGEGFTVDEFTMDFRVGGSEVSRFRYLDGPEIRLDAMFQDIVPNRRIVFTYRMAIGPQALSASLTTVELDPHQEGTRLKITEQGAFFDSADSARGREEGWTGLLEKLAAEALEVGGVECKYGVDRINAHDGHKARIINLDALYSVVFEELFPNRIDRWDVRQES